MFVTVQSNLSLLDGIEIGPYFQFDFPEQGGSVQPGNFDSITSENRYLYGTVTLASGVPEPSTWAMILVGFVGLGFVGYRRSKARVTFAST